MHTKDILLGLQEHVPEIGLYQRRWSGRSEAMLYDKTHERPHLGGKQCQLHLISRFCIQ